MSFLNETDKSISLTSESYSMFDPTILEGYSFVFSQSVRTAIIFEDEQPDFRQLEYRIFEKRNEDGLNEIKIEIMDDKEVGLLLICVLTQEEYENLIEEKNLKVDFSQFTQSLIDLIMRGLSKQNEERAKKQDNIDIQLLLSEDYSGKLVFLQSLRLRSVEVFSLDLHPATNDFIRAQVQYRFNQMKLKIDKERSEYETKLERLKSKNPQLAEQIQRSVMQNVFKRAT